MTEILRFQKALAADVGRLLSDIKSTTPDNTPAEGVTMLLQELPLVMTDEEMPYPLSVVRVYAGTTNDEELLDTWVVPVIIWLGIHWEDEAGERQGHRILAEMIERITNRFLYDHHLDHRYMALGNIEWEIQENSDLTSPYYFGSVSINFTLPKQQREDKYC